MLFFRHKRIRLKFVDLYTMIFYFHFIPMTYDIMIGKEDPDALKTIFKYPVLACVRT